MGCPCFCHPFFGVQIDTVLIVRDPLSARQEKADACKLFWGCNIHQPLEQTLSYSVRSQQRGGPTPGTSYCKIWCSSVRAYSSPLTLWETVKIFVHRAPSRNNLRKAVWLATVRTAIGAMISLSLVILGSLSVPMWVSLTPVGTTRLSQLKIY